MAENFVEQPTPPIMLEPGLRYAGSGTGPDGMLWLKFVNTGRGRVREVVIFVVASAFHYHYAIRDPKTDTIIGYEGPHGDPSRDESFIYGTR